MLNAKQHAREAEIVAQAGRPKMITIATNMAGRGTDIVLGGNVEKADRGGRGRRGARCRRQGSRRSPSCARNGTKDHELVKAQGGLRIIATERHESRRIDNQLRGRSGRQGDPGSSRFYLSLDDPLMRIFAGDRVKAIMDRLKMPDGEAIEAGIVTRSIESAQRKVEARNFDIRKQLLEYDDVVQRPAQGDLPAAQRHPRRGRPVGADRVAARRLLHRPGAPVRAGRDRSRSSGTCRRWRRCCADEWGIDLPLQQGSARRPAAITDEDMLEKVVAAANEAFDAKVQQVGQENFTQFERIVLLQSIDTHWREHLAALDYLRQGIHLRGYAQKQPKQEYKREAFELFGQLLDSVKNEVTRQLMTVRVQSSEQLEQAAEAMESRAENIANVTYTAPTETGEVEVARRRGKPAPPGGRGGLSAGAAAFARVGRNDPCPCGSGKKYKQCHGKLSSDSPALFDRSD